MYLMVHISWVPNTSMVFVCDSITYTQQMFYLRESNEKNEIYWLDLIHYSFGYAVTCVIGDSVSGAIVLAVFYVSYFVLIWKGNQVPLTVEIMHFVCICGVAIGYLVLTKQVMPVYKAHIGFALFVLINGSAMCFAMAMTHEK
eukprot:510874_1